ncbi:MAG: molecular chaperone TorD family protein [Ideonella sp.]|nr:molecular chaperone TorD family protein [Ideonella sp.]
MAPGSLRAIAEDLRTLAWLHASEHRPDTWLALHAAGFPRGLVAVPARCAEAQAMAQALTRLRVDVEANPQRAADELDVDYADIYLTHALRASPCESVWCDDDHLVMQGPTFAVREFYRQHGAMVADRRRMSDDHLSHQLEFLGRLLDGGQQAVAAQFLHQHLMVWLPRFAARVAERAATPVYAALAALTLRAGLTLQAQLADSAASAAAAD